jgi:hypothetical protein
MHEGRGFQGLAGLLLGQPLGGQAAQLLVDQGKELDGSARVPLLHCVQKVGDVVHT